MEKKQDLNQLIAEYKALVKKYNEARSRLAEFLKESKQKTKTK